MRVAMKFTVRLDKAEEGGFTAQCVEIPGAVSEGETEKEAMDNIADAIHEILVVRRQEAEKAVTGAQSRSFLRPVEVVA
jgi:predicted RNase H-like HicB family nuclease